MYSDQKLLAFLVAVDLCSTSKTLRFWSKASRHWQSPKSNRRAVVCKNLDSDCDRTKMSYSPLSETAECVQRRAISKMTNWITKIDLKRNPFTCEDGVVLDSL